MPLLGFNWDGPKGVFVDRTEHPSTAVRMWTYAVLFVPDDVSSWQWPGALDFHTCAAVMLPNPSTRVVHMRVASSAVWRNET